MTETLAAAPGSPADSGGPARTPASKDKNCPFCHAPFTASSLGRHLDLYIKEKNPKPPDGIHLVEEIQKLRGNVTRRQPRNSSIKREDSTPSNAKLTPAREPRSPANTFLYNGGHAAGVQAAKMGINRAGWQVAGANDDVPPSARPSSPAHVKRRIIARKPSIRGSLPCSQDTLEERDQGLAAELALKELLGNIRTAMSAIFFLFLIACSQQGSNIQ